MKKYSTTLSTQSKEDLKKIVTYIKNELNEPQIAERYARTIKKELESLCNFPQRHELIENDSIKDLLLRKLVIKNYIAFYRVNEEKNIVSIERILYGASNWNAKK